MKRLALAAILGLGGLGGLGACHAAVRDQVLVRSGNAPAADATFVSGTVRDAGGRPLGGVVIVVRGPEVRAATDATGRFRVALPEGLWQLAALRGDAEHALGTLPFTAGTETTLAITLGDRTERAVRAAGPPGPLVDTSTNTLGLTIQQQPR